MRQFFVYIFLIFISYGSYSQNNHAYVSLKEKIQGKRLELFAVNTDSISYDVFLRVVTNDYRRSSNRPILLTIAPNSETRLLTMVKLANKKGNYESTFIVNQVSFSLTLKKDHEDFEIKFDNALQNKRITIFTRDRCVFCDVVKSLFNRNAIKFQEYNISNDTINIIRLAREFRTKKIDTETYVPILKIEDSLYTKIKSRTDLIDVLKDHL